MKVTLEFDSFENAEELEDAMNGSRYKLTLEEMWDKIFRPRHKHGYNDPELNKLLESEECSQLMDKLEKLYLDIRNEV